MKWKRDGKFGPLGRKSPLAAGKVPPTTRQPQVVPPEERLVRGFGSPPAPEKPLRLPLIGQGTSAPSECLDSRRLLQV